MVVELDTRYTRVERTRCANHSSHVLAHTHAHTRTTGLRFIFREIKASTLYVTQQRLECNSIITPTKLIQVSDIFGTFRHLILREFIQTYSTLSIACAPSNFIGAPSEISELSRYLPDFSVKSPISRVNISGNLRLARRTRKSRGFRGKPYQKRVEMSHFRQVCECDARNTQNQNQMVLYSSIRTASIALAVAAAVTGPRRTDPV